MTEAEKKNDELREMLAAERQILTNLKKAEPDKSQETCILKERINDLVYDLEERDKIEKELLARQIQLEDTVAQLQTDYQQTKEILQVLRDKRTRNKPLLVIFLLTLFLQALDAFLSRSK